MNLRVVSGSASRRVAAAVAAALGSEVEPSDLERFPDSELRPNVADLRGADVYLVQPTGPPVNEHLVELLLTLDAYRRAGADRLTAIVPYLGYARQDRRTRAGEALGVRVVADAVRAAGADRLVVVDPHTAAFEAMCGVPVEVLSAVPVIASTLTGIVSDDTVVVAPDLGATKLAERYASRLGGRPVAVVRKTRTSGEQVEAHELMGDVGGRPVLIVDDMISTGATIEASVALVRAIGSTENVTVAATHGPLVTDAIRRITSIGVERILVTDTLESIAAPAVRTCSVGPLLAEAVRRLHSGTAASTEVVDA
jgi:ribose-phosphate pyrophosphokinase